MEKLTNLRTLELGANKLETLENLDNLKNLSELVLSKNKLKEVKNLGNLKNLKFLAISVKSKNFFNLIFIQIKANHLVQVGEGLLGLDNLEELYLSENYITEIEGIDHLVLEIDIF